MPFATTTKDSRRRGNTWPGNRWPAGSSSEKSRKSSPGNLWSATSGSSSSVFHQSASTVSRCIHVVFPVTRSNKQLHSATLLPSFYPTTSAVPTVSFLILHLREIQVMWSQTVREKNQIRERIKRGKSSADVPGTRAQQERQPRNKNYEKILNK